MSDYRDITDLTGRGATPWAAASCMAHAGLLSAASGAARRQRDAQRRPLVQDLVAVPARDEQARVAQRRQVRRHRRRGEAEPVGEGRGGGGVVERGQDGGPAAAEEPYERLGRAVGRLGPQARRCRAPGRRASAARAGRSRSTTSGQEKTLGIRTSPWPPRSRTWSPVPSIGRACPRPRRAAGSSSDSSPPSPTSARRREWKTTSASRRARSRGQSGSTRACQAPPAGRPAPAPCGPDRPSRARPRGDSSAPGVSASASAHVLARRLRDRPRGPPRSPRRRWPTGPSGGGPRKSGLCPRCGISSHSGRRSSSAAAAAYPPQPVRVVAVPVGAVQGADRLLRLPQRGHREPAPQQVVVAEAEVERHGPSRRGGPKIRLTPKLYGGRPARGHAAGHARREQGPARRCPHPRRPVTAPSSPSASSVPSSPHTPSRCSASSSARSR